MTDPSEDFAALFEASIKAKRFEKGQTIEGTIVAIGPDVAFVDVGGKGEATIDVDQLKDADGDIEVSVGDAVQAVVVSTSGGLTLSRTLARGAATDRQLEDAFQSGLPVEGRVERAVKGGFEIRVGRQRAFCPMSQMDTPRAAPVPHEGQVYRFRIIEYKDARNLVVSRRALVEEEQRAAAAEVRKSIVPGAVLTGRVASVTSFGAFVDLGAGVQGLLHVSEMGWSRVSDPSEMVKPGEAITVKVLRVDEGAQKISLGLKQLALDPWTGAAETFKAGQALTARVSRVAEFGVFVDLAPGVTGLVPASETGVARDASLAKAFPIGATVRVIVLEVDAQARRIRLSATAVRKAEEDEDLRAYTEREPAAAPELGSLADKLRSAMKPRDPRDR